MKMKMTLKLKSLFLVPVLALLAACGGGGDDAPATPTTPAAPTVVSIAVTPANPTLSIGATQKMVATGTYSDGKVSALTTGVTWTVKGPALSVAADGTVTAKTLGTDTVTAAVGAVSGATSVTVKGQWAAVAAGGRHNVARHLDGNLHAWGSNLQGQLGDNTTIGRNKPAVVAGANTTWRQIAAGEFHTLALRADGTLWAWGFNQNGQLGDGTSVDKLVPTKIGTGKWLYVAAGKAHSLGIDDKGALWAWGRNFNGQLGDATVLPRLAPVKITVAGTATWTAVAAGDTHSLGRRSDGTLWAWGGNASGQLGNGDATGADVNAPVQVGTQSWASISAGGSHSAAIRTEGTLWTWGDNLSGQLGLSSTTKSAVPVQVVLAGNANNWSAVSAGLKHTVAIRTDGTLWTWGSNSNGQIGNNTLLDQTAPVQIGTSTGWTSVAAGGQHSIGMMLDNTLWTWGLNADGQLGNGQNTDQRVPVLVVQ
jgi:hypothetical protein